MQPASPFAARAAKLLLQRLRRPALSLTDSEVVACAVENDHLPVIADDLPLRRLCQEEHLRVVGTVGLLARAKLDGRIPVLKPLLDQLITAGFRLDPHGLVYTQALRRVGESP